MKPSEAKTPEQLLRDAYKSYVILQQQLGQVQVRLVTIVEVQDWTPGKANEILGTDFFVEKDDEDNGHSHQNN